MKIPTELETSVYPTYRAALALLIGTSFFSACGGSADSAERPDEASVPAVESPAPAVEPAATPEVEPAPEPTPPAARVPAAPRPKTTPSSPPAPVEEPKPEPAPEPEVRAIPVGTALTLTLDQELSTDKNVAGDAFSAHLTADLLGADGEILLPAGTVVRGQVTEAVESPSSDVPAMMRLQIVDAEIGGELVPLVADVEEMQLEASAKDSDRRTAGKVAVGAAAGALLGKLAGKSKTKTAVAGAAAGAAVAIVTRDGQAKLPQGSQMIIRIMEPVPIR